VYREEYGGVCRATGKVLRFNQLYWGAVVFVMVSALNAVASSRSHPGSWLAGPGLLYPVLGTVIVGTVIVIVGFHVLAAYIVRTTGKTAGIADIGREVGAIIAALTGRQPDRGTDISTTASRCTDPRCSVHPSAGGIGGLERIVHAVALEKAELRSDQARSSAVVRFDEERRNCPHGILRDPSPHPVKRSRRFASTPQNRQYLH
jgi:hypothetical protein